MIDLALPSYGQGEPCCVSSTDANRKYYPNFHYEGEKDIELPESGTMVVKFKRTSREESDRNGKTRYSYSVDVVGIDSINGDDADLPDNPKSKDEASSALDKIVAELKKGK